MPSHQVITHRGCPSDATYNSSLRDTVMAHFCTFLHIRHITADLTRTPTVETVIVVALLAQTTNAQYRFAGGSLGKAPFKALIDTTLGANAVVTPEQPGCPPPINTGTPGITNLPSYDACYQMQVTSLSYNNDASRVSVCLG